MAQARMIALLLLAAFIVVPLASGATDRIIVQINKTFSENEITIGVGDRLIFANEDTISHNVFSGTKGFEFDLGLMPPGQSGNIRFSRKGTSLVECAIHPQMKLKVHVGQ